MEDSEEGIQVLKDRPFVRKPYVIKEKLAALPENTFGYKYYSYMTKYNLDNDERPIVNHIGDLDLAYIS